MRGARNSAPGPVGRLAAAAFAAALVGGLSPAAPVPDRAEAAVFGEDERRTHGARTRGRFASVGLLYTNRPGGLEGTGVLVAPLRILSAAHVLYREGQLRVPLADYRFRVGSDFVNERYEEVSVRRIVAAGTKRPYRSEHDIADDWVVLELAAPIAGAEPAAIAPPPGDDPGRGGSLRMVGFHADVAEGLRRVQTPCSRIGASSDERGLPPPLARALQSGNVWLHDCDASGHSSGAGLFERTGGSERLVGMNVGGIGPAYAERADPSAGSANIAISITPRMRRDILAATPESGRPDRPPTK